MYDEIRTRFAPSPTGPLHIGSARTALFNWLYCKKNSGKFILRIEDSDRGRSREEFEIDIADGLAWLGLSWDEGPETPDVYGPYRQSERQEIYKKYIDKLLESKKAYYCYCTEEELETERQEQEKKHLPPRYSGRCKNLSREELAKFKAEGRKPAIRFEIPTNNHGKIKFKDIIHGEIEFDSSLIGDFIIVKASGEPIFLLTNIIDDAEMKISHVIRGDDHLSNTPKQIMLADALDLLTPDYAHLPMILNPDRTKLSKRKNPTSLTRDFRDKGYLPEAMINFLAFLGWTPKAKMKISTDDKIEEFFTLDELVDEFDLSQVSKSPAIFDEKKLDYLNGYYIRKMSLGDLAKSCMPYLIHAGLIKKEDGKILDVIGLVQERMKKLSEAPELTSFFFQKPKYDKELLIAKNSDKSTTQKALLESKKILEKETDFSCDSIEQLLRALADKINIPAGKILWPIRVALSGKAASPGVFELIEFFQKQETLERIQSAIDMLQ